MQLSSASPGPKMRGVQDAIARESLFSRWRVRL